MIPGSANPLLLGQTDAGGFQIERSLRFNSGDSAYLNRTPSAAGNQNTWTWSGWIKKHGVGTQSFIFGAAGYMQIYFSTDQILVDETPSGGSYWTMRSTAVLRDPAAWYHCVFVYDSTQSTASNRFKVYVNNSEITSWVTDTRSNIVQNNGGRINSAAEHRICRQGAGNVYANVSLAEVNFIDGQALAPTDFGEFDDNGGWQAKEFTETYIDTFSSEMASISSGNVFPANGTSTINALDGSTSTALDCRRGTHSGTTSIRFTPSSAIANVTKIRVWSNFANKYEINGGGYNTFTSNGSWAEIYNGSAINLSEITVIRDSGNSGADYGHQLHAIEINDVILTRSGGNNSFHLDFADNSSNAALGLDTSGVSPANTWTVNNLNAVTGAAANQSQTWSSSNTGYHSGATSAFDGNLTTSSFASGGANANAYVDITAITASKVEVYISAYGSGSAGGYYYCRQTNNTQHTYTIGGSGTSLGWVTVYDGSQISINRLGGARNSSGSAGSAQYGWKVDGVLLVNAGTAGFSPADVDSLVDSPVNGNQTDPSGLGGIVQGNYAVLNPLTKSVATLSEGNLLYTTHSSTQHCVGSTFAVTSGKWYWEYTIESAGTYHYAGIADANTPFTTNWCGSSTGWTVAVNTAGNISYNHTENHGNIGSSPSSGQVWGWALDMDAGTLKVYVNGVIQYSGNSIIPSSTSLSGRTITPAVGHYQHKSLTFNYGQRPYKYQNAGTDRPSADYKSLCTTNLPEPGIPVPSQYFETKLWSGNGSAQKVSNFNFSPDLIWGKSRTGSNAHWMMDNVRGAGQRLIPSGTSIEDTKTDIVSAITSDGFTIGNNTESNATGSGYVSWAWDAGEATTTIAVAGLNSSVYDQSQRWRSYLALSSGASGSTVQSAASNAFNGNTTSTWFEIGVTSNGQAIATFNVTLTNVSTLEFYGGSSALGTNTITVTGTGISSTIITNMGLQKQSINVTNSTVSNLTFTVSSDNNLRIAGLYVNGKLLVDDDVTPTNVPTIPSTVRSSPESGFSIVSYTGDQGSGARTIAHGLNGSVPELIITKNRDGLYNWITYSAELDATKVVALDENNAAFTPSGGYYSNVGSHVYELVEGSANFTNVNNNSDKYIAYVFSSIKGFSSFGSFQNPSSSDGAFVPLDFKPALLIIKCAVNISSSSGAGDWIIKDTTRSPFNNPSDGNTLVANVNDAEDNYYGGGQAAIDILSNGFKIRHPNSSPAGDTGRLYIYAAWAKSPFKTARAQ